jgi:hypothetical protein
VGSPAGYTATVQVDTDAKEVKLVVRKPLTIVGAQAQDKVYDGNSNAVIINAVLNGIDAAYNDVAIATSVGTFDDASVGVASRLLQRLP